MRNDENLPGKGGTQFKITLRSIDFKNHTMTDKEFQITSEPTTKYNKWYWKVLNKLTFGLFFNQYYYYTIKRVDDDTTV